MPSLQGFTPTQKAQPARPIEAAFKPEAVPLSDPFGAQRLARSKVKTFRGYQWLANDILRGLDAGPPTRAQQDEIRAENKRLMPGEIDPNAYRQRIVRKAVPYERRCRSRRGWVRCEFVLPKQLLKGLKELAKFKAGEQAAQRLQEPYGYRRRYPKTVSRLVSECVNRLLAENGFSEYLVDD
jgi:hypothetical protein